MSRVVLPGALRQYSDGASSIDFPASEETTLADVLDAMEARCPRLSRRVRDEQGQLRCYVNVYLDGTDVPETRRNHSDRCSGRGDPGAPVSCGRVSPPSRRPR